MKYTTFFMLVLLLNFLVSCQNSEIEIIKPPEDRFQKVMLATNLDEPMELEVMPNGNVLLIERTGNIKLYDPKSNELRLITRLHVYHGHEDGLLGLALDPHFSINNRI
ncbi:MAG: PQQ-dependent sugar dehydrogenase, partial [Cyclobacteriaceae bacterium]|nr:PQQ-dependent sugar dehydrogenase [Cyclobacteriaceae bacterium]